MDDVVGRDAELARLEGSLRDTAAGRGRLVLLGGDAGIGKTRLAEELARRAQATAVPAVWGRGVETEGAPPFWPWRQVLRVLAARLAPGALREAAGGEGPTLANLSPELGRALGTDPGRLPDGHEGRFQLFDAVSGFLCRSAAPAGLLVILDDVHRADPSSLLLLQHLAGELQHSRLLVLATHRDADAEASAAGVLRALTSRRDAASLHLEGLDRDACRQQLQAVVGRPVDAATAARVHAITEGNPFFTDEMARLLLDASPAEQATASGEALEVPYTVREVVRRRVAQLPGECRELLAGASVIGRDFDTEVLAVMTERSVVAVLETLDAARRARVVEAAATPGGQRFAHVLVCETLVADLSASRRRDLHARAADALEWLHAKRLDPHLSAIALHRLAAAASSDEAVAAAVWLRRAADHAMARRAWEEGVRLHRLALDASGDRLDGPGRARALVAIAEGLAHAGELGESLRWCIEASRAARAAGLAEAAAAAALVLEGVSEPRWSAALVALCTDALAELPEEASALRARVLAQRTTWRVLSGDRLGTEEDSAAALSLAERSGDGAALASALRARQVVRGGPDGVEERAAIAMRMLELGGRTGDPDALLWGRIWRIEAEIELGDLAAAGHDAEALAVHVDAHGTPVARWHLYRVRSVLAQARGEFEHAVDLAARARDIMERAGHAQAAGMYEALLSGSIARHRGVDEERLTMVRELAGSVHGPFAPLVRLGLASQLLWCGRVEDAHAEYRLLPPIDAAPPPGTSGLAYTALRAQLAAQVGECADALSLHATLLPYRERHIGAGGPEYRGCVELPLGVVQRHCGEVTLAVEHLRRAVAAHRRNGALPFVVDAQCELAETLLAGGAAAHRHEVRALAADALQMAQRLGMTPFVERAARLLDAAPRRDGSPLSRREEEVAALVARGLTSREIAAALYLSERTAQNHVQHILDKLGFATRSQIAAWVASRAAQP